MPRNPLSDPNWASDVADRVEAVVGKIRDRTTKPALKGARLVVYGLLAGILGLTIIALTVIFVTRGLQTLLELAVSGGDSCHNTGVSSVGHGGDPTCRSWPRAVYLSYLLVGGILTAVGLFVLRKRHSTAP